MLLMVIIMKINCNHYNGNNTTFQCPTCKEYYRCTLIQPTTPEHQLLQQEIDYWLNELRLAKKRLKEYLTVLEDIKAKKYCYPVNVYGNIQYAPKQNVFGVTIRMPEHVIYGWNWNKLIKAREDVMETIRGLRLKELELRKELVMND